MIMYTDGGARGNPGPAAVGIVFCDEKGRPWKRHAEQIGTATNNEAEYSAVFIGLKKLKALMGGARVAKIALEIRLDSQLIARQLRGEYKVEEDRLAALFMKIWNLKIEFGGIDFVEIPREENKDADRLVNDAFDQNVQSPLL